MIKYHYYIRYSIWGNEIVPESTKEKEIVWDRKISYMDDIYKLKIFIASECNMTPGKISVDNIFLLRRSYF